MGGSGHAGLRGNINALDYHGCLAGKKPGRSPVGNEAAADGPCRFNGPHAGRSGLYHWVFLKGAREGWPVVGSLVRLVVKDEFDQRDRFMRENLDAMARRVGEMQAKMMQLESLGERVSGLAGVNPAEIKATPRARWHTGIRAISFVGRVAGDAGRA
jgi:hypothetical protein